MYERAVQADPRNATLRTEVRGRSRDTDGPPLCLPRSVRGSMCYRKRERAQVESLDRLEACEERARQAAARKDFGLAVYNYDQGTSMVIHRQSAHVRLYGVCVSACMRACGEDHWALGLMRCGAAPGARQRCWWRRRRCHCNWPRRRPWSVLASTAKRCCSRGTCLGTPCSLLVLAGERVERPSDIGTHVHTSTRVISACGAIHQHQHTLTLTLTLVLVPALRRAARWQ
jgi:hypothetical protein